MPGLPQAVRRCQNPRTQAVYGVEEKYVSHAGIMAPGCVKIR
jgi:hypothetical protein